MQVFADKTHMRTLHYDMCEAELMMGLQGVCLLVKNNWKSLCVQDVWCDVFGETSSSWVVILALVS